MGNMGELGIKVMLRRGDDSQTRRKWGVNQKMVRGCKLGAIHS
jgi:hypothetical protein